MSAAVNPDSWGWYCAECNAGEGDLSAHDATVDAKKHDRENHNG